MTKEIVQFTDDILCIGKAIFALAKLKCRFDNPGQKKGPEQFGVREMAKKVAMMLPVGNKHVLSDAQYLPGLGDFTKGWPI
ncbi:MAG: hypothetical protein ACKO23_11850 [Gemmataceae bacterium]